MEPFKILSFALLALSIIRPLLNLQSNIDANNDNLEIKSDCKPVLILDMLVQSAQERLRASIDNKI